MKRRAFTLMELVTVMSILAILYTIGAPAIIKTRNYAYQHNASMAIKGLMPATNMYMADSDDQFPISGYKDNGKLVAWFGREKEDGTFDPHAGILASYLGRQRGKDPVHYARPLMGDMSGFGYNWGFLGSDSHYYNETDIAAGQNPAFLSELSDPSRTIAYATSAFYNAQWLEGGDGLWYDYGFIDPPFRWNGNPTVDCRHGGQRVIDQEGNAVNATGVALVAKVDGSVKALHLGEIKNDMFERAPKQ